MKVYSCILYLHFIGGIYTKSTLIFDAVSIDKPDLSVTTILKVKSAAQCGMECLKKAAVCIAFTYNASADESCYLYGSISSLDKIGTVVFAVSMPASLTQKKDLEPGTTASMSTLFVEPSNQDYGATNVIDGVYNDELSVAHTLYGSSPWIQIHLTQNESIKGAKIWNRCGCRQDVCDRLNNVLISISEDYEDEGFGVRGTISACSYSPGTQPAIRMHRCYTAKTGSYMRVTMVEGKNFINIHEVEIHV